MNNSNNNKNSSYLPIKEGDTTIFYVNMSGFPLCQDSWKMLWSFAKELQPGGAEKIDSIMKCQETTISKAAEQYQTSADVFARPIVPYAYLYNRELTNEEKIEKIQNYIDKLQYNHTGLQFFNVRKDRPLIGLMELARKIIDDSLPIKCLEAVILAIYLINEIHSESYNQGGSHHSHSGLEKFSIGFKTSSNGNIHRHVVLGIYCHSTGLFGALGTSRRSDLAYKPLRYKTLTDLIMDYIESYSVYLHKVKRFKIGNPIPHSSRSYETISWNGCSVNLAQDASEWPRIVEKHSKKIRYFSSNLMTNNKQLTTLSLRNLTNLNLNHGASATANNTLKHSYTLSSSMNTAGNVSGSGSGSSYLEQFIDKSQNGFTNSSSTRSIDDHQIRFYRSKSLDQPRLKTKSTTTTAGEGERPVASQNLKKLKDLKLPANTTISSASSSSSSAAHNSGHQQQQTQTNSIYASVSLARRKKKSLRV